MSKKILIIEDEKDVLTMVYYTLRTTGCNILRAETGEEGVLLAQKEEPDVIVLDLVLPDIGGVEVARQIREIPSLVSVPIILMTASVEEIEAKALKIGANSFLTKPFEPKKLLEEVKKYL